MAWRPRFPQLPGGDGPASVTWKNTSAKWFDGGTPPSGFNLYEKGLSVISTSLVSAIQANILNYRFTSTSGLVQLPPLPGPTPTIPPMVITEAKYWPILFWERYTSTSAQWFKFNCFRKHQWDVIPRTNIWIQCSANQLTHRPDFSSDNSLDSLAYPRGFDIFQQ